MRTSGGWLPWVVAGATLLAPSSARAQAADALSAETAPALATVSLSRPFLLDDSAFAQLAEPSAPRLWGIAWDSPLPSPALEALARDAFGSDLDGLTGLADARFVDSVSVAAAVDTLLQLGSDTVAPPPPVIDDALDAVPPDTTAQVLRDSLVGRITAFAPADGDEGPIVPEEVRAALQPLVGVWFPDGYMLRTALRTTFAELHPPPSDRVTERILSLAQQAPGFRPDSLNLQPLAWTGDGCGCGFFDEGGLWEPEFYGIYPFWEAPQTATELVEPDTIDLSLLTRIGYYGLTFDGQGRIQDPLHWRTGAYPEDAWFFQRRDFSDFSITAQRHKVSTDVIVYQGDWSWLPDSLDAGSDAFRGPFETLRSQLLDVIAPPLENFTNVVKPFISLGNSPTRTLGDGITLHFDFSEMGSERQEQLFEVLQDMDFFGSLKDSLMARGADGNRFLRLEQDYRLNVIVPLQCIQPPGGDPNLEGPDGLPLDDDGSLDHPCGFYSVPNMSRLRTDSLDLFLVDLSAVEPGSAMAELDLAGRTRRLRSALDRLDGTSLYSLVPNVLPLAVIGTQESPEEFVRVADLSFSGVGGWSARRSSMDPLNDWLEPIFLSPAPTGWLSSRFHGLEQLVCRYMCPARWTVRFWICFLALLYVGFWLLTESRFDLKRFYTTHAHLALVVVFCLALVGTLWCDPYWKARQTLIVSVVAVVGLSVFVVSQFRLRRERHYP